jgi:hypothetical protein
VEEQPVDEEKLVNDQKIDDKGQVIKQLFAMKTMDKRNLYKLRSIESVKMEMRILS